ncbi:MAG: AMP-binding protein [Kordiimonadales bacterium]|nr:MAG: AMP-binding protein [Kordiimonadales bacterium]
MTTSALSYVCGTSDTPLLFKTIGQMFDETASLHGAREAVVVCHQNIRWTYAELKERVDAYAAGFLALGLNPGDRIGIWSPNNIEWVITQFASAKAGLVLVNINPAYRSYELEHALKVSGCSALVLASKFKTSDYVATLLELEPAISVTEPGKLQSSKFPGLHTLAVIGGDADGFYKFEDIAGFGTKETRARVADLSSTLQPDDPINIQFTSGTTGAPKGATLTHHNILNNGYFVTKRQNFTEQDKLCVPVPLYHCFGMVMAVLGSVSHGACMVFPSEAFEPAATLRAVAEENCTALYGVPTMFIAMLDDPSFADHDFKSLRTGAMGGSPCPVEVMKRVISDMHMSEVTIAYGMTETSPASFQCSPDDPLDKRVSTVGTVLPFVEVKLIDTEGKTVPRGTQGELLTRGYSVMQGYWNDPERTADAIDKAGWMHTGDLAVMDPEDYVSITGRLKDMIIRGGENIYPREIEEFLYRHPAVIDAQVFGIPDEKYGEAVAVWLKVKPGSENGTNVTEDDIRSFCKGQIAHFKVPAHIRFVDEFPMTITGKIQKFVMRDQMIEDA